MPTLVIREYIDGLVYEDILFHHNMRFAKSEACPWCDSDVKERSPAEYPRHGSYLVPTKTIVRYMCDSFVVTSSSAAGLIYGDNRSDYCMVNGSEDVI